MAPLLLLLCQLLSRVPVFETQWTVACQVPLSMEFWRQEYWSGLPFPSPGELPNPGIEPGSPALQADSLQNCSQSHQGSLICLYTCLKQQCLYFKVFTFLALLGLCCGKGSAAAVQGPHYPTDVGSQFPSVQLLSRVLLFSTPQTAARQASLSITNSQSLLKLMSIVSVMPSTYLIFCGPLLLPPSIFPSIRVFSNESVLCIRWPKQWIIYRISKSKEGLPR